MSDEDDLGIALALRADAEKVTADDALPWLMAVASLAALILLMVMLLIVLL